MRRSSLIRALICASLLISSAASQGQDDRSARLSALTSDVAQRAAHGRFADAGFLSAAKSRFKLMSQLAETDPRAVLDNALSEELLSRIPARAKGYFETRETFSGELEVLAECEEHTGRIHRSLKKDDSRIELYFADEPSEDLLTGAEVNTTGVLIGDLMTLEADGMTSTTTKTATEMTTASLTNTTGEKRVLVILVNFQDKQTQPFTVEQARDVTFNQTSNFIRENSYGQTWLTGDVYGWYTLPLSSTVCDIASIANYGKQAAANSGANLSTYNHIIYGFPRNACPFTGNATVGGSPTQSWINEWYELGVVGHEFGHNLGLYHSRSLDCGAAVIGTTCTSTEYGDYFDMMGAGQSAHYNLFQKERLGWVNYGNQPPVQTVSSSGTYWIDSYASPGSESKGLKVLKSIDPVTGRRTFYYLERRTAIGFDTFLSGYTNVMNGVVVHTGSESDVQGIYVLDMTPETASWYDPALTTGKTFTDSDAGVSVTVLSADNSGALVSVEMAAQACVRANPTVAMSPGQSSWMRPGSSFAYSVSITNNNYGGCSGESFNLSASIPGGLTGSLSVPSLNLSNGASATVTLNVSSMQSTADGSYGIGFQAANASNDAFAAASSVSFIQVSALAVSAAAGAAKYSRSQTANVAATVMAAGFPVGGETVTFTMTKPGGMTVTQTVSSGSDGRAHFSYKFDRKRDPIGTYTVTAAASTSGYSGQASTSFMVNK